MRMPLPGGPAQPVLEASGITGWAMRMGCPRRAGQPCVLAQQQGREIVFRAFDPQQGFGPGGDEIARIPVDPNHQTPWGISPDGSQLAYARWNAGEGRIHVLPLEANAGRLMVRGPGHEVEAVHCSRIHKIGWRADGRGWFVTTEAAAGWAIASVQPNGHMEVLLHGLGPEAPDPIVSPDGKRLVFSLRSANSNVWLIDRK